MNEINKGLRVNFSMPPFMKRTNTPCPKCGKLLYIVNNVERCGECSLIDVKRAAEREREKHYQVNGDVLGNYNQGNAERSRKRQEKKREDYKSRQYKG